ncbi:hypothetical protein MPTK1_3g03190 [Marchantia polymorpha subsp. ruderalis]|uniref:Uncharacterized protein n=2 Tax=Marchantia polymorpha TaxID=3197 RepID=A0A176VDB2_MARPO|nr:hypothetical protein AXG93_1944s1000 [Marchantia polymorpha subsp. ruderalis]PTQ27229.1 hypothetical protein MARPO_0212s0007 [Marchantia polymorpha]BBN04270.1 hypothetical protein Mp_3g03190 [Marchantia polymorpha subsp. ruderalis]|eukprot:PTQ27229.1 hypothetical protein MARPO_0212s0007 [Marchantia polymorpha]
MGSLMAGWQTQPSDAKEEVKRVKKTVTKADIENFWRSKEVSVRSHLQQARKDAYLRRSISIAEDAESESGQGHTSSESGYSSDADFPPTTPKSVIPKDLSIDWWTKSRWAFLNEPPAKGKKLNGYMSQFHLDGISSEPDIADCSGPDRILMRRGSLPAMQFKM